MVSIHYASRHDPRVSARIAPITMCVRRAPGPGLLSCACSPNRA